MEKKYQIFISSTYEDLKEERRKVQDTILEMYQFPIGMEMFSADDEEQWEIIQETIDSSDYYVLIVGHRYGSVIEEGDYAGISYTQKEFRYALEKKIPILAFLIADSVAVTPDKMEDKNDKKEKLEDFKKEVATGRTVQWWTSSEDLANKVSIALNKQIHKGKRPGWIRANKINIKETQNELIELYKKNRNLEKENEQLRRQVAVRKPVLSVTVNGKETLELQYDEYDTSIVDKKYMELMMEDVPEELKGKVTLEMISKYNAELPSKEVLQEFKNAWRFYRQAKENPISVNFTVCNEGTMKANDIYLEIQFPDEVVIYKNNSEIVAPEWPKRGKNPIDEYYEKKSSYQNSAVLARTAFSREMSPIDFDLIAEADSPRKCIYNDNNSLSIRMNKLMTNYTWSTGERFYVVPKRRGVFEIVCSVICEEYSESVEQIIRVVVQ